MKAPVYKPTQKKPGTCTVYVRFIEVEHKSFFKGQCARRDVGMIPACIEFMKRSKELLPLLHIKKDERRREKLDPKAEYTAIHIRPTPIPVRSLFKVNCAAAGVDMIVAIVEFMRQSDKLLPLLHLRKVRKAQSIAA